MIHLTGRKIQRSATEGERHKRGGNVQSRQNRQENSEESMEEDDYETNIWYILPTPYPTPGTKACTNVPSLIQWDQISPAAP